MFVAGVAFFLLAGPLLLLVCCMAHTHRGCGKGGNDTVRVFVCVCVFVFVCVCVWLLFIAGVAFFCWPDPCCWSVVWHTHTEVAVREVMRQCVCLCVCFCLCV